jgi:mono/diheme cytochrome c family protein
VVLNQRGRCLISMLDRGVSCLLGGWLCLCLFATAQFGEAKPAPVPEEDTKKLSFNDAIQPILSENCYACHGPDPGGRKAGLRLDRGEFAFAPHQDSHEKYGPAIIPGNPDKSPLVHRIEAKNAKDRMPPPEAHKTLKPEQIALLREWVKQGAQYEELWSFLPPKHQAIPAVTHGEWVRNAIDNFVLAQLEKGGLTPSPEADRRSLIRRVTYDLTGLPPTPEEVEAFVADSAPDAYEKVVEQLLSSPRYGEHRAHYWLDVARYGDTHGLHLDNFRSIWAYRDYVIRAYNQNKPFDQFVREQLAGDMLPVKTLDTLTASAYLRAGISSGEGGTLIEELRVNNKRERAEAYGAAFLGLTVGCANCHDHKFDPITQKDFYGLTAFFNNLTEVPSNDDRNDWPPFLRLPKIENREAYEQALAKRSELERQQALRREQARELMAAWIGQPERTAIAVPVSSEGLAVRLRFDEQNGSTFVDSAPGTSQKHIPATGAPVVWGEGTWFWPYMRMEISTRLELPNAGAVEANQAFSVGTWLRPHLRSLEAKDEEKPAGIILSVTDAGQKQRGWQLRVSKGKLGFVMAHEMPDNAIQVETKQRMLAVGRWNHVLATYDGSGKAAGVTLYVDGRPQELTIIKDSLQGTTRSGAPLEFGRAYPDADPLRQSAFQDFRFFQRALSAQEAARLPIEDYVAEIVQKPMAGWSEDEFHTVSEFYFAQRDEATQKLNAQIAPLNEELDRLSKDGAITLVSEEGPGLPYADVLARGAFGARTERVRPAVPHFLPALPANASLDRRGLAEWTVSPANPLTARVTVNRMWSEVFGTGLVETTEDFGVMGGRPSHPELLDWLALDFRENGWNVKRFYKQLVLSAAYRQSARVTPQLLEIDPKNRLLARGPRYRMDGEMLRDTALAASGLLVEKIGGPSVKPYQPAGVWEAGSHQGSDTKSYTQDHGEALYRRSLYTFWKRMATMPDMDALDVPVRDAACTRRQRTDTPLQALVLMNDPQWLEASRHLAERVIRQSSETGTRLDYLGEVLLARVWEPREKLVLADALMKFQSTYAHDHARAEEILKVGESSRDSAIPPDELASWMLVASAAMNLDAVVNK